MVLKQFLSSLERFSPNRWSISTKLLIALFSASTIPMAVIAYNNLKLSLKNLTQSESYKLEVIAVSNASRLDQLIIDNRLTVNQIARNSTVVDYLVRDTKKRNELNSQVQKNLDIIFRSSSDYDAVFVLDENGICRVSTDPTFVGQNYSFRDYFQQAIKGQGAAPVSLLKSTTSGRPGLFFAHPIRTDRGDTLGVAVLKIKGNDVWKVINSLRVNSHVRAFLVDEHGIVLAHPNNSFVGRSLDSLPNNVESNLELEQFSKKTQNSLQLRDLAEQMVGTRQMGHLSYYSPIEKTEQIAGFAPLETEPWVLGVNKPKAIFEAPMQVLMWKNVIFVLSVGGTASLVSVFFSHQLGRSIGVLIEAGKAVQKGDFNPKMLSETSRSQDDLGTLARVFLQMADEIDNRELNLKSQVKHLQVKIDNTKKERQIAAITGTEYFKELQKKARRLKNRSQDLPESEYFQNLHQKVRYQKTRFIAKSK